MQYLDYKQWGSKNIGSRCGWLTEFRQFLNFHCLNPKTYINLNNIDEVTMIGEGCCTHVLHMTWKNIQLLRIKNELVKQGRVSGSASPTTFPVVKVEKKAEGLSCLICTQAIWSLLASFLAQYAHLERICTAYLSIFVWAQRTSARKIFSSSPPIHQ